MARGGLAGIWDRNKKWLTPVAEGLVGMIPGVGVPLAAGLGAAIGGLDRPGQRGIGFDVGGAMKGTLSGAAMGGVGSMAKTGLSSLFTGGGAAAGLPPAPSQVSLTPEAITTPSVPSLPAPPSAASLAPSVSRLSAANAPSIGMPSLQAQTSSLSTKLAPSYADLTKMATASGPSPTQFSAPSISASPADYAVNVPKPSTWSQIKSGFGAASDFADKHDKATSLALQGIGKFLPSAESRALELKTQVEQDRLNLEKKQYEEEQQRRQRMAQFLIPLYQQYAQQFGMKPLGGA